MKVKKKYLLIATLILICVALVVLYAGYLTGSGDTEFDGTLVKACPFYYSFNLRI